MARPLEQTLALKLEYGDFDIGLATYNSGAIQLDGMAISCSFDGATCPGMQVAGIVR